MATGQSPLYRHERSRRVRLASDPGHGWASLHHAYRGSAVSSPPPQTSRLVRLTAAPCDLRRAAAFLLAPRCRSPRGAGGPSLRAGCGPTTWGRTRTS